jgi:hypothetical protein
MSEFSLTKNPVASLNRDLRKAIANNEYEFDEDGLLHVRERVNIKVGGVFSSWVLRHEAVQKAIETGDKLAEAAARAAVDRESDLGCFRMMESADCNQIPDAGVNFILDLVFGSRSKIATWYHGPFKTNWASFAGAQSNWAGATSGPLATELTNAEYDETNRQAAVFANPAATKTMTASAATRFTLSTGVSDITLYGSTLNSVNTVGYDATDAVLLAAAQFGSAKSGLGAADKIDIEYEIVGSST